LFAQLVSKIFNLCGPDPPTSQTDGQTDDKRSQDRALHYGASRGKNYVICILHSVKITPQSNTITATQFSRGSA